MKKFLNICAVILGILFVFVAIVYWMTPARSLPSYMPGYNPLMTGIHFKHGIAALILGIAAFVFVWFRSGKQSAQ